MIGSIMRETFTAEQVELIVEFSIRFGRTLTAAELAELRRTWTTDFLVGLSPGMLAQALRIAERVSAELRETPPADERGP